MNNSTKTSKDTEAWLKEQQQRNYEFLNDIRDRLGDTPFDLQAPVRESYYRIVSEYANDQAEIPPGPKKMKDKWFSRCLDISEEELAREKELWDKKRLEFLKTRLKFPSAKSNGTSWSKLTEKFKAENVGHLCSVELECAFRDRAMVPTERTLGVKLAEVDDDGSVRYVFTKKERQEIAANSDEDDDGGWRDDDDDSTGSAEVKVMFRHKKPLVLRAVLDKLLSRNATVNHTCGTHIHMDARGIPMAQASMRAKRLIMCLPALTKLVAKSRLKNEYCGINNPIRRGRRHRHQTDRYLAINFSSAYCDHETIENRLHGGTLDFWKIVNWLDLNRWISTSMEVDAKALANSYKKETDAVMQLDIFDLLSLQTLPDSLRYYVWKRFDNFYPDEASEVRQRLSSAGLEQCLLTGMTYET